MRTPLLAAPALAALRRATVTPDSITLPPERLERWVWQQVNAAAHLLGGGGRWNPQRRAWLYEHDPRTGLAEFLAFQDAQADHAVVPAGPLRELADRLEATEDTGGCGDAAAALRDVIGQHATAAAPAGFVVARRDEHGVLVDDFDGEIHQDQQAAEISLRTARKYYERLGYRLYALVVCDA